MALNVGTTNLYLTVGLAWLAASVAILAVACVVPRTAVHVRGGIAGYCFISGTVFYAIGRIVQARRSRAHG